MSVVRKRRSFMAELLLWILLLVVMPVIAFQVYFYYNSFGHMQMMEQEKALVSSHTAQKALNNLGESILGITVTNAYWEENRKALERMDIEWLKANIADMPEIVPTIDFTAETDLQGKVLVQSGGVSELTGRIGYPVILERFASERTYFGLLNTSKGLAIVAVSAVTDEQGKTPPIGLLITGRLLTNEILQKLSDMLQTDLSIMTMSDQYLASRGGLEEKGLKSLYAEAQAGQETFRMNRSNGVYVPEYASPLRDLAGKAIGIIHTQSPSVSATHAADDQSSLMIYVLGILVALVTLVIYLLRRRVVLPLRHFTNALEQVAAGRQIEEIPKHVMQAEAEIVVAIQQIIEWNQMLEKTVEQRTSEIRSLLDHTYQGFLSFGPDLAVKEQYSAECLKLFGREPGGLPIVDLLYSDDYEEKMLLGSILSDYFQERNPVKKDLFFSLLPDELRIGSRPVKVEFVPIRPKVSEVEEPESIMAMLTDMTETRQLEDRMQHERRVLRMVVQTVTHPEDFANIVRDFENFRNVEIWEGMTVNSSPREKASAVYRMIHTFKGSFAFLQFVHVVPKLHEMESGLQALQNDESLTMATLEDYFRDRKLEALLDEDVELLRTVLGASYDALLLEEGIKLDRTQWQSIEHKLESTLTNEEDRVWLEEFRKWRYRPVRSLFNPYADYLAELAERNGVLIHPVELLGGNIPVDPDRLYGFARSFVHVVRNAVVHGIESPEERLSQGKDEFGTISFFVEQAGDGLRIEFGDDGRGIDPSKLKEKAASLGLSTDHLSDDEALHLIFEEKMSTAGHVTEWSGRGIGLSVVKVEMEQLGGNIEIRTRKGAGTSFIFHIPAGDAKGEDRIGA